MRSAELVQLLPGVFQQAPQMGLRLKALLDAMEGFHAPSEAALAEVDALFDPRRTPDGFVSFLARWMDLELPVTTGLGRLRELVAAGAELSQWRGTARGLLLFLSTATGRRDFELDECVLGPDGIPRAFHICLRAPEELMPHRALLEQIIHREKPAYVTYELHFTATEAAGPSAP
ncbi:phage tail protein [Stigmatella aurantiaca]|uniref:NHL repeat domain protein n=1 Tax=Stigmatella aurantiaca (strain DW4/3-1) TaxID=378806 RepID=Q08P63_STIAD|nr:phage tail protein [Stigmatella aurantiaca]EAU62272.1 NHL repeat domain protein [Stigmatella aurantiaca DW4/3-1]